MGMQLDRLEELLKKEVLSLSEKIADSDSKTQKEEWATTYWNIALKAKHIPWLDRFRGIPLSLSFKFWKKRLLR